jgi:hypothetical protein
MPVIEEHFLQSAFYLYPSVSAANDSVQAGGSGFLVAVSAAKEGYAHIYAVTNKHVIDNGFHTLRLNTRDGQFKAMATDPAEWIIASDDDLAVLPLDVDNEVQWWAIPRDSFVRWPDLGGMMPIGPGEDVALIGRFVSYEGKVRNKPTARFGNISMNPDKDEPIPIGGGQQQVAFLVECRSLSGFSGSAVLVYQSSSRPGGLTTLGQRPPKLLGIDCAHIPLWSPVCSDKDRSQPIEDMWVDTNTGMAVVVPAWQLASLLDSDDLVKERKRDNAELLERLGGEDSAATS